MTTLSDAKAYSLKDKILAQEKKALGAIKAEKAKPKAKAAVKVGIKNRKK